MNNQRQSNFELLRIVAMLGVMTLHACSAVDSYGLMFFFSVVSVNVFILISGWFKIKLRLKEFDNRCWRIVVEDEPPQELVYCKLFDAYANVSYS